jgi:hypothetical protein
MKRQEIFSFYKVSKGPCGSYSATIVAAERHSPPRRAEINSLIGLHGMYCDNFIVIKGNTETACAFTQVMSSTNQ